MRVDEEMALELERYFEKHLSGMLRDLKLPLQSVTVGGKYNDEGILIELGFIHKNASAETCEKFLVDREREGVDVSAKPREPKIKLFDLTKTGLKKDKLRELSSALPSQYVEGTLYVTRKDQRYALVGFSVKKDAYVMWSVDGNELKFATRDKFKALTKLKTKK